MIRHPEQWEAVFGQTLVPIFTTKARNELLPSHDTVLANICSLSNSLKSLTVPQADLVSARLAPEGLLQHSAIQTVCDEVYKVVWAQVKKEAEATPWMTDDTAKAACLYMRTLRLSGGCWDKFTHKQYAVCQNLMERRAVSDTLFGDRFQLWGWADTPVIAQAMTLDHILENARQGGVIADVVEVGLCRKAFTSRDDTLSWLRETWIPSRSRQSVDEVLDEPNGGEAGIERDSPKPPDKSGKPVSVTAPTLFDLLKWKSQEFETPALKFRTIVSYKNHPLQLYCRVISRCLQKGLEETMGTVQTLGFSRMLGVRDMIFSARRLGASASNMSLSEMDMDDMFWQTALSLSRRQIGHNQKKRCGFQFQKQVIKVWTVLEKV